MESLCANFVSFCIYVGPGKVWGSLHSVPGSLLDTISYRYFNQPENWITKQIITC
jgi:hypothetical protein